MSVAVREPALKCTRSWTPWLPGPISRTDRAETPKTGFVNVIAIRGLVPTLRVPGRGLRMRKRGAVKSVVTRAPYGSLFLLNSQSTARSEYPCSLESAFTTTAVRRANAPGFVNVTAPRPPWTSSAIWTVSAPPLDGPARPTRPIADATLWGAVTISLIRGADVRGTFRSANVV